MRTKDLFIVDNSKTEWSASRYLKEWCDISSQFDIATGYFEIGALLDLDGKWQSMNKIRILFGDEVTKRTKEAFAKALSKIVNCFDNSIENEKEGNEFLLGVPAIINAIRNRKIECRVYRKDKFHAKTYITYLKEDIYNNIPEVANVPKGFALVGSSNFTYPGLNQNIELNVQVRTNVEELQEWFEKHWNEAEEVNEEILRVAERQIKEFLPFEVYVKAMHEYLKGGSQSVSEWENNNSNIFPILEQYQKDGYYSLLKIAERFNGAFLCDGVGLGKTFVGLMLIERLVVKENKRVVLIVPASARKPVWEANIKKYLPQILDGFYTFKVINHTDLLLDNKQGLMHQIASQADCVIIDEAHNFRNQASQRYRKLLEIMGTPPSKKLYMLTATPINNSFLDIQHLIELFTVRDDSFFKDAPLGIHSLKGHFMKMENSLNKLIHEKNTLDSSNVNISDYKDTADDIFLNDNLVNELVVQRSRTYVKKSLAQNNSYTVLFPKRLPPTVANYSLKKSYGKLIDDFIRSFDRFNKRTNQVEPLLLLPMYSPYDPPYYQGDRNKIDPMKRGRRSQVVQLIRLQLLKRFESSAIAFEDSCIRLYKRLYKFVSENKSSLTEHMIKNFSKRRSDIIEYVYSIDNYEDVVTEEMDAVIVKIVVAFSFLNFVRPQIRLSG